MEATEKRNYMCLTIPKKIITREGDFFVVENPFGVRQEVKSIIKTKIGDNVLTQSNVIVQKISKKQAQEIAELIRK